MKMNKKVFILFFSLLLFILACLAFLMYGLKKGYDKKNYTVEDISLFNDNKYVMVTAKNDDIFHYSQNYITDLKYKALNEDAYSTSTKIGKDEYFKIKIYDLRNPSKISSKEIDVNALLGTENTYRLKQFRAQFAMGGKEYIALNMSSKEKGQPEKTKSLLLSLDTGKIDKEMSEVEMNQLLKETNTKNYTQGSLSKSFSWARGGVWKQINGVLSKHGFYYATGYLKPTHHKEMSIDVSGTNFSNLYPKITAQLKKKKKMHYIYFRPDQYKEQEWFNDSIHWFAPKDQNVLEIYATDEETGEKTQIHSFSEFRQWVINHPQKKE